MYKVKKGGSFNKMLDHQDCVWYTFKEGQVVKLNDDLFDIAKKHGLEFEEIQKKTKPVKKVVEEKVVEVEKIEDVVEEIEVKE